MANSRQTRLVQNKISRREQERIEARKQKQKASFSTIAMRVTVIIVLAAMLIGLAVYIIAYN